MNIIVKISYFTFAFDDINEAVAFAETAAKHSIDKDEEITLKISFGEDD